MLVELAKHRVCMAEMHYEGQGDEGAPVRVSFYADEQGTVGLADSDGIAERQASIWIACPRDDEREYNATRFVRDKLSLGEALETVAWDAVDHLHGGFWLNQGGEGDVRFHPDRGSVVIRHDDFITDTVRTETRL